MYHIAIIVQSIITHFCVVSLRYHFACKKMLCLFCCLNVRKIKPPWPYEFRLKIASETGLFSCFVIWIDVFSADVAKNKNHEIGENDRSALKPGRLLGSGQDVCIVPAMGQIYKSTLPHQTAGILKDILSDVQKPALVHHISVSNILLISLFAIVPCFGSSHNASHQQYTMSSFFSMKMTYQTVWYQSI